MTNSSMQMDWSGYRVKGQITLSLSVLMLYLIQQTQLDYVSTTVGSSDGVCSMNSAHPMKTGTVKAQTSRMSCRRELLAFGCVGVAV